MARKHSEHTGMRNGKLFCFNCGEFMTLDMPMRVTLFTEVTKAFSKTHKDCLKTWEVPKPDMSQSFISRQNWWLTKGERGMSSDTIFSICTGTPVIRFRSTPCDPDDFRRCYLLLQALPELRDAFPALEKAGEVWKAIVQNWDHMVALLEKMIAAPPAEKSTELYDFMKSIGC